MDRSRTNLTAKRRSGLTEPLLFLLALVFVAILGAVSYLGGGAESVLAVLPLALLVGCLLAGRFPGEEILARLAETRQQLDRRRGEPRPSLARGLARVSLRLVLLATARALRAPPPQGLSSLA